MTKRKLACEFLGLLIVLVCCSSYESESRRIRNLQIPDIDLNRIDDGQYTGAALYHDDVYTLAVDVDSHRITKVQVLSSEGDRYDVEALPVLDRVIDEQRLSVDAVSGATRSSKLYLIAIYNALTGEELDY